jgi:hypothetical protein
LETREAARLTMSAGNTNAADDALAFHDGHHTQGGANGKGV